MPKKLYKPAEEDSPRTLKDPFGWDRDPDARIIAVRHGVEPSIGASIIKEYIEFKQAEALKYGSAKIPGSELHHWRF